MISRTDAWPADTGHPSPLVRRGSGLSVLLSLPVLMWLGLWFGINSGPGELMKTPAGMLGWAHYLRTLFPIVSLAFASILILGRLVLRPGSGIALPGPIRLWLFYCLIGLLFCVRSPRPDIAVYFSICYLSVIAAMKLWVERDGAEQALHNSLQLNYFSWFVAASFLLVLVVVARDVLIVGGPEGLTGYNLVHRGSAVGGVAMIRSSGLSRFAAVPGIVSFVWFWTRSGWERLFWAGGTLACAALIYLMQSRGALIGFGAALAFVTILLGNRVRWLGAIALAIFAVALVGELIPGSKVDEVTRHLTRSGSREKILSMQGRTRAWQLAREVIADSPMYGWGPQADRGLVGEHVHNTYLYAWLQSGFLGLVLFVGGLLGAWLFFVRAIRSGVARRLGQQAALIQIGGLLAFFTVRSIPEVCGALYAVDLMVMLPAMSYLSLVGQSSGATPGGAASARPLGSAGR